MTTNEYRKLSIIVLGETGHGKSLFCKLFSNSNDFQSKKSSESVTTSINSKTFRIEDKKVEVFLIDTPGFNDSRGKEQEKINMEETRKFLLQQQRINCIIIVISSKIERITDSLKNAMRNICKNFPLPDFWSHVIIFWTKWYFRDSDQEKEIREFINNEILDSFKNLSKEIESELKIKQISTLNMLFNEYDENTTKEDIKIENKDNTQKNFDKIIELALKMDPLYEKIIEPEEKDELQEPKEGVKIGNNTIFTYKKIRIRKYKDFGKEQIIEIKEIIGTYTITMQEEETEWEKDPSKSTQEKQVFKKYKKRIFLDEKGNECIPKDIAIPLKEEIDEKTVEIKTDEKLIEGKLNRKKIFQYENVYYKNQNKYVKENEKFIKEIEEGETQWIEVTKRFRKKVKRFEKYRTYTEYDENGNKIGKEKIIKEDIIDWKEIVTKIENNIPIKISPTLTKYINKIITEEVTKKDLTPKIINTKEEDARVEEIKEEEEILNQLNDQKIGKIMHNFYKVKYIDGKKEENKDRELIRQKCYTETYIKDDLLKTIKEKKKDGKEYEINFYEIKMIDSRFPNVKQDTSFRINEGKEKISHLKTKIEVKEIKIENDTITKQNYLVYYNINPNNGKEIFDHEEKEGKEYNEKIKYEEKCIIEEPMTQEIVNKLRTEKKYPISYRRIYYKQEINTTRKLKIDNRIENVEIRIENINKSDRILNNDKKVRKKLTTNELIFINGEKKETNPIITNYITYELKHKDSEEEIIENDLIKRQNYKIYYYIDENGKEIFEHKEKVGKEIIEKVKYGKEYGEIEPPMSIEKINILKRNNDYPISYIKTYYKNELNTKNKNKIKTDKRENVFIQLEHIIKTKEIQEEFAVMIEEYDIENIYINDVLDKKNTDYKINYKKYKKQNEIISQETKLERKQTGMVSHWFSPDEYHYDIYEVKNITYADGTTKKIKSFKESKIEKFSQINN